MRRTVSARGYAPYGTLGIPEVVPSRRTFGGTHNTLNNRPDADALVESH